jgi:hypothetical protein
MKLGEGNLVMSYWQLEPNTESKRSKSAVFMMVSLLMSAGQGFSVSQMQVPLNTSQIVPKPQSVCG